MYTLEKISHVRKGDVYKNSHRTTGCRQADGYTKWQGIHEVAYGRQWGKKETEPSTSIRTNLPMLGGKDKPTTEYFQMHKA